MQRIVAEQMIPGRGEPVRDAVVVLDGPRITYAGPAGDAPDTPNAEVTRAVTVMPGMWDAHVHVLGATTLDLGMLPRTPVALRAARATAGLRAAVQAGFTSVREVGGVGVHLAQAVAEGTIPGPAIYASGAILSTTGGHGDLHSYPLGWMSDYGHSGGELRMCDGEAECVRAVREQLRLNAKVIKICASGGVLSEIDHPIHQQFTIAEMRAMVEVAGMAERAVAAHCHGKPGMMAALEAGVRTIEHGTYLDEEVAAAMVETGAVLVPTRTIIQDILDSRAAPPYGLAKLDAIADRHVEAMAIARAAGVTFATGTDVGLVGADLPAGWGRHGRELPLMAQAGFTPLEVIEAATANGPGTLGPQAPRSGQLVAGYDADVLTVDGDPLQDLRILADTARITGVWQAGRRSKG